MRGNGTTATSAHIRPGDLAIGSAVRINIFLSALLDISAIKAVTRAWFAACACCLPDGIVMRNGLVLVIVLLKNILIMIAHPQQPVKAVVFIISGSAIFISNTGSTNQRFVGVSNNPGARYIA